MNKEFFSITYFEEATDRGIQQRIQGVIIESVLQVNFGYINEELAQLIEPLIQLQTLAGTQRTDCAARSLGIISSF